MSVDRVSVSPLVTALDAVRAAENRKLPAVLASHSLMCEMVSEPDAQLAQVGVLLMAFDPALAADQVAETRVVFALAAVAALAPGSAVWSLIKEPAGVVNAVPPIRSNHLLARLAADIPTVIPHHP